MKNFDLSKSIKSKADVLKTYQTALKEEFGFVEDLPGVFINAKASNQDNIKDFQFFQAQCSILSQIISMVTLKDSTEQVSALKLENDILKGTYKYANISEYI